MTLSPCCSTLGLSLALWVAASQTSHAAPKSTQALLTEAKALFDGLEYDKVIPAAEAVLARADANVEMKLDAHLLLGSSLAIVGRQVEAERAFRLLLRGRPDYELPAQTSPKIVAVFRKVQAEERTIAEQERELRRSRIMKELRLEMDLEQEAVGGRPLIFEAKLRDPGRAVEEMRLHYRRAPSDPFSILALKGNDAGVWHAEIPGEWTENDQGFVLEYFLTTHQIDGTDLLKRGDAISPLKIPISPGTVSENRPYYKSPWFWAAVVGAAVSLGVGTWVIYDRATALPEDVDGRIDL
ncbi:MAG: hypothetical protein HYZ27_08375 [Deltaproteobacteria bacterium]|nr:hypothetical protein [Deltaproteobacteria bacterium]